MVNYYKKETYLKLHPLGLRQKLFDWQLVAILEHCVDINICEFGLRLGELALGLLLRGHILAVVDSLLFEIFLAKTSVRNLN